MSRILLLALCSLLPALPASAVLLAEIKETASFYDTGGVAALHFTVRIPGPGFADTFAHVGGGYFLPDVGRTIVVDPVAMAKMERAFHSTAGQFELNTLNSAYGTGWQSSSVLWSPQDIEQSTSSVASMTTFVPQLSYGLIGYTVTQITQTIDAITFRNEVSNIFGTASQTIRLYGERRLAGDYNQDDRVDAADYIAWRNATPGTTLPNTVGDPHPVADADYTTWRLHFGESVLPIGTGTITVVGVPEPSSLALLLIGSVWHISRRCSLKRRSFPSSCS